MDLSAIKKNIESGVIRTTAEFQRDIMLMFQNAVMYNSSDHDVYHMALEMQRDVLEHVQQFLATQLIMQTSESAISAKSLRGREGNRKPGEPAEKVGFEAHFGSSLWFRYNLPHSRDVFDFYPAGRRFSITASTSTRLHLPRFLFQALFCIARVLTSVSLLNSCFNISLPGVHVEHEVLKRRHAVSTRISADVSSLPTSPNPSAGGAAVCAQKTRLLVHLVSVWTQ